MEKRNKIIYWISTGLFSAFMLFNVVAYLFLNEMSTDAFTALGYPGFVVYFLALAKSLGIIAILSRQSSLLKEWAYAGFFLELTLASLSHFMVGDGGFFAPIVAIILLVVSRIYDPKVFGRVFNTD